MSEIQLISGAELKLSDNSNEEPKNGLISDIFTKKDNLEHIFIENDMTLTPGKSSNCSADILSGILEETLLSKYFFSDDNMKNIQKMIRYNFYNEKNKVISEQSNLVLLTIMRGIFLKYSNSGARSAEDIKMQVIMLNEIVTEYSLKQMYSNYDMYHRYLSDIEKRPPPHPHPKNTDSKSYTYNLSERNNFQEVEEWSGITN